MERLVLVIMKKKTAEYMKQSNIEIIVKIGSGSKNFTAYTMDLTKNI